MMPQKDPFAQVLCDLAVSIEISKQVEAELGHMRERAIRQSDGPAAVPFPQRAVLRQVRAIFGR